MPPKRKASNNNANYAAPKRLRQGPNNIVCGQEVIDLSTVTIQERRLPLKLNLSVSFNGAFEALLPFPRDYPPTALKAEFEADRKRNIVEIKGVFSRNDLSYYTSMYGTANDALRFDRRAPFVYIEAFYGIDPAARQFMSKDEAAAFRGLARRCMCATLSALSRYMPVSNALLVLHASGQVTQEQAQERFTPRAMRAAARELLSRMNQNVNKQLVRRAVRRNWQHTMGYLQQRAKEQDGLEKMYQRAFGLQPISRTMGFTLMAGRFSDALQRCATRAVKNTPSNSPRTCRNTHLAGLPKRLLGHLGSLLGSWRPRR